MTEGWAYGGAPQIAVGAGTVTAVEGSSFCISGRSGDLRVGAGHGLFFRDTRFLSRFELTVDGQPPEPLAVDTPAPYAATFVTRRPPQPGAADSTLLVLRRRYDGNGMLERIAVENLGREPAGVVLALTVDTDFAGLFEVKEGRVRARDGIGRDCAGGTVTFDWHVGADRRGVTVDGGTGAAATDGRLVWQLVVPPHTTSAVVVHVRPSVDGVAAPPHYHPDEPVERSAPAARLAAWRQRAPRVSTGDHRLARLLYTSAEDVGVLRMVDPEHPDRTVVAAGAPWFMTLFGRDSLLTSWMLLPLDTELALGTLRTLADLQGTTIDPLTEEEPGRILHEVRSGLDPAVAPGGHRAYYGSADATPLFVMLLGELHRWGVPWTDIEPLLPAADRALDWMERYGDRDGDGFVEYRRATDHGLLHQGWKDSFDAVSFADGTAAEPPIALAEVQGYAFAAYRARARLARAAGDDSGAAHWSDRARVLKERFNAAFWLPDRGYLAMALDRDKRPVDALASNMGHCLWTGVVDTDRAPMVAAQLLSDAMFSGFGVRTLATSMAAYNPVSYHNGSVWPHDNAVVAAGLSRYGFLAAAQRIALGLVDAANLLGGRLPELFCGFDRSTFRTPVGYPTSCAPQAWSAAAPLLLLRSLLRFHPDVPGGRVRCDPAVPGRLLPLRIERVGLGDASVGIVVDEHGWRVDGLPAGLRLEPAPAVGPAG